MKTESEWFEEFERMVDDHMTYSTRDLWEFAISAGVALKKSADDNCEICKTCEHHPCGSEPVNGCCPGWDERPTEQSAKVCPSCHGKGYFYDAEHDTHFECGHESAEQSTSAVDELRSNLGIHHTVRAAILELADKVQKLEDKR